MAGMGDSGEFPEKKPSSQMEIEAGPWILDSDNYCYGTPETPFSAVRLVPGRTRTLNERKKTQNGAKKSLGDFKIALDMFLRSDISSDNNN